MWMLNVEAIVRLVLVAWSRARRLQHMLKKNRNPECGAELMTWLRNKHDQIN